MLFPILFSSTERLRKLPRRFKIQGSYSFELFKFHDFFLVTLGLAVTLQNFPSFRVFFDLKQFTLKCMPFALFNYFSVSYFVLALSSAVTNLPKKTLTFHNDQLLNSMTFWTWKMKFVNSMTFTVFHDLHEPRN